MCQGDSITIKDPVTGSVQCQDCLKCRAGEGLSVNCGDVIAPKKPVMCEPCVLGETYSSGLEAGACKDCENCGEYRETVKPCTLTSKAVCGKCKPGAYPEAMLAGMCQPCSPCCNDGKDIVVPECQVLGVPANMQCSFARSEKCSKVIANTGASTTASPLPTTEPITIPPEQVTIPPTAATIPAHLEPAGKQQVYSTDATSINWAVSGSAIGGAFGVVIIVVMVVLAILYFKNKRKQACKNSTDMEMQRVPGDIEAEIDEPNPEDALLDSTRVPLGVEETLDSPLPTGTQDTQPPGLHSSTGKLNILDALIFFFQLWIEQTGNKNCDKGFQRCARVGNCFYISSSLPLP